MYNIQQEQIKMIRSVSKNIYNVTKSFLNSLQHYTFFLIGKSAY